MLLLLLLLSIDELLDDVRIHILQVDLLVLQQLDDLLKLILRDLLERRLLFFLLLVLLLHIFACFSTTFRPLISRGCLLLAALYLPLLLLLLLSEHLLLHHLLLLLHGHLLLDVGFLFILFIIFVIFLSILVVLLLLLLLLHIIQVFSTLLVIFLDLTIIIIFVLNLLATAHDLVTMGLRVLKDHLLALDVLDGLVLLLLPHVVLDQLLGEGELVRVLLILLLQVL